MRLTQYSPRVHEDETIYSIAARAVYWHTTHQQYFRLTCSKHKAMLISSTDRFDLPPLYTEPTIASAEVLDLENRICWMVEQILLAPFVHRRMRRLEALKQKLNISNAKHLSKQNTNRLRSLHHWFAEAFNQTGLQEYFAWDYMHVNIYPLNSAHGLYFMLDSKNNMHPMICLMLCYLLLTNDELIQALETQYAPIESNGAEVPFLLPLHIPHAKYA